MNDPPAIELGRRKKKTHNKLNNKKVTTEFFNSTYFSSN